jgi:N-acetylmuramoyl-L-alanine amidase
MFTLCFRPGLIRRALLAVLPLLFLLPGSGFAGMEIQNVRHWTAPDQTRVVFDVSDGIVFSVRKENGRVFLDFQDTTRRESLPASIELNKPSIEKIVLGPGPGNALRAELHLPEGAESKVFRLKRFQDKPERVVVDLRLPAMEKKESETRQAVKKQLRERIVVIDPGHGGDDPGAVSRHGTKEKDVVLQIGKKLRDELNGREGYRAFLTRTSDYYVPFRKRVTIAKEYGADLFVSVHADAVKGAHARGSSVYALSLTGASTEAARLLASNENLSDIIGGVAEEESGEETDAILLNMFQTNTINRSKLFGSAVLNRLGSVGSIKFASVQEAPFRVLKLPDIPSVLVETAYISNPEEEKLLKSRGHQQKIAGAIADAITEFLPAEEIAGPDVKIVKKGRDGGEVAVAPYTVKRGETLFIIARNHGTTLATMLRLNKMKIDDPLLAGQKIKVPAAENEAEATPKGTAARRESATKRHFLTYRVRKGESLTSIAREKQVTLQALLEANDMKLEDPLYAGRRLKIPVAGTVAEGASPPGEKTGKTAANGRVKTIVYRVKKGDNLTEIAQRYHTSVQDLMALNSLKRSDPLYVNQKLRVPAPSAL